MPHRVVRCRELRKLPKPPTPLKSVNVRSEFPAVSLLISLKTQKVPSHDTRLWGGPRHQVCAPTDLGTVRPNLPRRAPLSQQTTINRSMLEESPPNALRLPQSIPNQTRGAVPRAVQAGTVPCAAEKAGTAQRGYVDAGDRDEFAYHTSSYCAREDQASAQGGRQTHRYAWSSGRRIA